MYVNGLLLLNTVRQTDKYSDMDVYRNGLLLTHLLEMERQYVDMYRNRQVFNWKQLAFSSGYTGWRFTVKTHTCVCSTPVNRYIHTQLDCIVRSRVCGIL